MQFTLLNSQDICTLNALSCAFSFADIFDSPPKAKLLRLNSRSNHIAKGPTCFFSQRVSAQTDQTPTRGEEKEGYLCAT